MGENSAIEWCDHTFNPFTGCTKVSPGCANCYAETLSKRNLPHIGKWGPGAPRKRTSESNWRKPLTWNQWVKRGRCGGCGKSRSAHPTAKCAAFVERPRVFCASLADWLDPEVPAEWLRDLLALIGATPHLDWLLLTKRIELWRPRLEAAGSEHGDWVDLWLNHGVAPANVWLGTTVEDQQRADERIPWLVQTPARVRFLSCEPLLEAVDLGNWIGRIDHCVSCGAENPPQGPDICPSCGAEGSLVSTWGDEQAELYPNWEDEDDGPGIHWVICGGESGTKARAMDPLWARSLRDQCQDAEVSFLFKQWGAWAPGSSHEYGAPTTAWHTLKSGGQRMAKVGKKTAGRELDGRTWDEVPQVISA